MLTSHHACLNDEILSARSEKYSLLEPCEVLIEEEWILGGLTPWVDDAEESDVNLVHMDGTQDEKAIVEAVKLEDFCNLRLRQWGLWLDKMSRIILGCRQIGIGTRTSKLM